MNPPIPATYDRWEQRKPGWRCQGKTPKAYRETGTTEWTVINGPANGHPDYEWLEAVRDPAAGETPETDAFVAKWAGADPERALHAATDRMREMERRARRAEPDALTKAVCSALYNCSTLRHGLFRTPLEFSRISKQIVSEAVRAALPPRSDESALRAPGASNQPPEGEDAS